MFAKPLTSIMKRLAEFRQAPQGVVAIEFAVVGLPFFMLLYGIMVIGFMMFCSSSLDYATQKAARQVMVGTAQSGTLSADQFRTTVVCPLLPATIFDCSKVVVNMTTVSVTPEPTAFVNFVKSDQSGLIIPPLDNTKTSYCTGAGGNYQVLEILYPLPLYMSLFASTQSVAQGQFIIMSTAAFKNENFSSSTTSTGC